MKDKDFIMCPFIRDELGFLTYYDFCKNAKVIKKYFKRLEYNAKLFYKWYVYSNIHIGEYHKNIIWDFLNDQEEYKILIDNKKTYKIK